jgi:uncharacterized protein
MPEYLAPGVFVEETSFRAKSIEGVSTTTTGFVGPTRFGPVDLDPEIITSLADFEAIYGGREPLRFTLVEDGSSTPMGPMHNYMWHAVRAFFEEGGKRLYVARVFRPIDPDSDDGHASVWVTGDGHRPGTNAGVRAAIRVAARFPGSLGRMRVRLTLTLSQNVLGAQPDPAHPGQTQRTVNGLLPNDVVWIRNAPSSPPSSPLDQSGDFYLAESLVDDSGGTTWRFTTPLQGSVASPPSTLNLSQLSFDTADPSVSDQIRIVRLSVMVTRGGEREVPTVWSGLPLDPSHLRAGQPDSVFDQFAEEPASMSMARRLPIEILRGRAPLADGTDEDGTDLVNGIDVLRALLAARSALQANLARPGTTDADRSIDLVLDGGNDGQRPQATDYEGQASDDSPFKTGLKIFEDIEDISIVAAPGSTFGYENGYRLNAATIVSLLISHAQRMQYRIAVIDSGDGQSISDVRRMRAQYDSTYAAFYYPWVRILDPVSQREVAMPPSGFVAGIYARNDSNRAVYKAPANEVVNLAVGFEKLLNKAQQEVLNPEGINCFRFFEGRGNRLWGARTISSDPEWKYVNLRRYFAYLERSIDRGTQWAVFEPNGDRLWANVRQAIRDFLVNEWQGGALLGERIEQAFFVRCDRSTMTQNDLDNGRLVCLIGLAPVRPAEFVIMRIGQWTADRRS